MPRKRLWWMTGGMLGAGIVCLATGADVGVYLWRLFEVPESGAFKMDPAPYVEIIWLLGAGLIVSAGILALALIVEALGERIGSG